MNEKKAWYQTGMDAVVAQDAVMTVSKLPRRFFVLPGQNAQVVFVDDEAMQFNEHSYRKGEDWRQLTCSSVIDVDLCCKRLGEPYYVGLYTVVDCTRFVTKDGKVYQYEVKVFAAKINTLKMLRRKRIQHTSFAYTKCSIYRDTDKSPNCGNEFTFGDPVKDHLALFNVANYKGKKLSDLFDKAEQDPEEYARLARTFQLSRGDDGRLVRMVPPFNYEALYEPHSADEIQRILAGDVMAGGQFQKDKGGTGPGAGPGESQGVDF